MEERERLGGEVAAADEPLIVLFDQERAREPDRGGVVGEDADDVAAAADLAVDPLERVRAPQLRPVRRREGVEGEQVLLGLLEQGVTFAAGSRSLAITSPTRSRACSPESALKTSLSAAETSLRWQGRQCWCMFLTKWTVQRCQGQASTRAIALRSPSC